MKILHLPYNIAGQPTVISRAQRTLGHTSDVLVFHNTKYNYECDFDLKFGSFSILNSFSKLCYHFIRSIFYYDVFHFYYTTGFIPYRIKLGKFTFKTRFIDVKFLKIIGKKVIMQYVGSDVIQKDKSIQYNIFPEEMFDIIYPYYNDIERKEILNDVKKTFDKTIVIDRYLQAFSQESELVDLLLDVSNIPYIGCKREDSAVNVLHAPTNRDIKGTQHILNTIEKLKDEGYKVNLIIVENKKHEDAMQMYKDAHIVVDDINQGPYGLLALECMAMGKPIVGRINEHFTKYYTDLPTVNTNKDTIYKNLKHLIEHPETCEELGKLGREYVIKHHDAINIAKKLILIYESL